MRRVRVVSMAAVLCAVMLYSVDSGAREFRAVAVIEGEQATVIEKRAVQLLADRIAERADVEIRRVTRAEDWAREGALAIVIGVPERHAELVGLCREERVKNPTTLDPGGEGFVLKLGESEEGAVLLAAGVDERGVLYAVGEILRLMGDTPDSVVFPEEVDVRKAPGFAIRGLVVGQGVTMQELTGARDWTTDEWRRVVLDYALAGANTFELGNTSKLGNEQFEFVKSYGLDTLLHVPANVGSGPVEWQAVEAIGRPGYLCPSIPEARQALLERFEAMWRESPPFDYVRFVSGDGGGCECDACRPYGGKYIRLVADMARIIRRYSPETKVFASNQKLDNAGDQAIFDYLNDESDEPFLRAFCYGPGSNAMGWTPGRRQDHRMDLFDHPGFGPWSRYPQEILHQLPQSVDLVMFTDLTHWVYSQYGLMDHEIIPDRDHNVPPPWGTWLYDERPDPALAMVYDRRTFHARPRAYHRVFQAVMPFAIGDVAYSEGHHDHVNQWMWQRLLWDPHRTVEDVVGEYARTWFGPEAAEPMAEAMFQLERNLSTPIADNPGIDRLCELVRDAGVRMPARKMEKSYLWRQYMQKALLDKYVQLRLRAQLELQSDIGNALAEALDTGEVESALAQAEGLFARDVESVEMRELRAEAGRLGEESDTIFGVRNVGYSNLDRDFIGFGWLRKQLADAAAAPAEVKREIVSRIVHYEDPGEGGFYDDAGDPARSPHLTYGWPFGDGEFSETNRVSQRTAAFTTDEENGVRFEYTGLDSAARYLVRFTLVRPSYLARYAMNHPQKTQSIYVDDFCLADDLELPEYECGFFEFDIPHDATADGELVIQFRKSAGVGEGPEPVRTVWRNTGGWGTLCSEVWLMKTQ